MKRKKLLAISMVVVFLLNGCSSFETKTYILDEISEEEETRSYINIDKIYSYIYNSPDYRDFESLSRRTAWFSPDEDTQIIINQYDDANSRNFINKINYDTSKSQRGGSREWQDGDIPHGVSADGNYMFFERRTEDIRYLMLYDYLNDRETVINQVNSKDVPSSLFKVVFCWEKYGNKLVYGWKYTGEPKHVVALDEEYYYNNWRYGKERVYSIKCYDIAKKESTTILESSIWKANNKVYNYSLQINDYGQVMLYSKQDNWLYLFPISNTLELETINKTYTVEENYWLGNKAIYTQDASQRIVKYDLEEQSWDILSSSISDEVDYLTPSKDGNTIYFSIRQKSTTYIGQTDKVYNIYRYNVEKQELECMYQGAEDVIGLDLSRDGESLMVEMKDMSSINLSLSYLSKIFVLKS